MAINFEQSLLLLDNVKLNVGTSSDLQIYHDGSNSYIEDNATGDLYIQTNGTNIFLRNGVSGNTFIAMNTGNDTVDLKYNGSIKLTTTNTGISITGGVATTSSSDMAGINMTSNLALGDNDLTDANDEPGTAGQLLSSLGSGNGTDWITAPVDGVTSVATSAPITGGTITGTGTIGITQADATTNGYLSSTDWNTFNNKGSGTVTGTGVNNRLAIWSGTSSIDSDSDFYVDADTIFTTNLEASGKVVTTEIESASTILLDAAADITIDAGGQDIILSDDGTIFGTISNSSGLQIRSRVNNADMFLRGVDDGSEFNALTLDMSEAGAATFNDSVTIGDIPSVGSDTDKFLMSNGGLVSFATGAEVLSYIGAGTGSGTVTSVTGSSPISSTGGTTPAISIATADASTTGALTSTDWNTFNNKTSNTGTVTSVAVSGGTGISVSGSPITSSGTITISADNNGTVTSIATTSPITGGTITGSGTIAFDSTAVTSLANLNTTGTITDGVWNSNRKISKTSSSDFDYQGDIVYWHSTTVTGGKFYVYQADEWVAADADAESTAKGVCAIALGNGASNSVGMLIRGTYTLNYDPGSDGELIYISTTAGNVENEPPSGSGDVVRIVGQILDSTNGQIFFNPDNTFITLS